MTAHADPRGCCPRHPYVQLRGRSRRTGRWRTLLDHCPVCAADEDSSSSSSSDGGGDRGTNGVDSRGGCGVDGSTRSAPDVCAADCRIPAPSACSDGGPAPGRRLARSVSFTDGPPHSLPLSVDLPSELDESDGDAGPCEGSCQSCGSEPGGGGRSLPGPAGTDEGRPLPPAADGPASDDEGGGSDAGSLSEDDIFSGGRPRSIEIAVGSSNSAGRSPGGGADGSDRSSRSLPGTSPTGEEDVRRRLSTSQSWDGEEDARRRERRRRIGEHRRRQLAAHGSAAGTAPRRGGSGSRRPVLRKVPIAHQFLSSNRCKNLMIPKRRPRRRFLW